MLPLRFCEIDPTTTLPDAIWISVEKSLPAIYRGSPLDMVRSMSCEMDPDVCPKDAIHAILGGLSRNRGIHIRLDVSPNLPDETYARIFIFALLDQHVARPLPTA